MKKQQQRFLWNDFYFLGKCINVTNTSSGWKTEDLSKHCDQDIYSYKMTGPQRYLYLFCAPLSCDLSADVQHAATPYWSSSAVQQKWHQWILKRNHWDSVFSLSRVSPSACKSANIDLVLLIDGSKSVRPQNFELVKKFVNQVRQRYHTLMYYVYLKNLKICINTNKKLLHRWDECIHQQLIWSQADLLNNQLISRIYKWFPA